MCFQIAFTSYPVLLKNTGIKHHQIKLQRLQKVGIWAFGLLVHQINSLRGFQTETFQKNKVVTGKFFVISPFHTHHSICLGF